MFVLKAKFELLDLSPKRSLEKNYIIYFLCSSIHHRTCLSFLGCVCTCAYVCVRPPPPSGGCVPVMLHVVVSCSRFNPEPWAPRGRFAQPAHSHHFRSHSTDLSTRGLPRYVLSPSLVRMEALAAAAAQFVVPRSCVTSPAIIGFF